MILNTSCADCIFAKREDGKQIACYAGILERFTETNGNVDFVDDSYVLNGKVCMYRRYEDFFPDLPIHDRYSAADESIITPVTFIIQHKKGDSKQITKTIKSIMDCKHFTEKGRIIIAYTTKNIRDIGDAVEKSGVDLSKVTYVSILDPDADLLSESFKVTKNGYFCQVNSGFSVPEMFIDLLHHCVNKYLFYIGVVEPVDEDGNLRTVLAPMAKYLKLDLLFPLEDKINALLEEQGIGRRFIYTWEELYDFYSI